MSDLAFRSATDLAAMIRRREVSSRELLDHYLARVERWNPDLNAVVTLDAERARTRADSADTALARGEIWGPLHGLPITIKDTFETAGLRTTAGHRPLAEHVPAADAPVVGRLVAAGAVVFGKTNTPLLAGDLQSYNEIFGTTNNPWDRARTPGGSSGGSAAALAAGLSALEVGSDIGGSIRVPAHWCGVYGHKPTHGILPLRGHIPGPPGTLGETDLAVAGPMARSVEDLEVALDLMAGPLPDRAVAWRLDLPPARRSALQDYRVAAWLDDRDFPVDPAVRACLAHAVEALRRAGVRVNDSAKPSFDLARAVEVYERLLWPVIAAGFPDATYHALVAEAANASATARDPGLVVARCGTERHRDWLVADEARAHLRAQLADFFRTYDVLLMPVNQVPAIPHDHSEPWAQRRVQIGGAERPYPDLLAWISVATLAFHPATVVPIGKTPAGLPVGLQIVGPFLEDRTPLDFARRLSDVIGGFTAPRGFV